MRSELFPFQKKAVWDLRRKAAAGLAAYRQWETPQIVSLQAPTGSGKTLMAAALLEDILCGTAEPPPGEAAFEAQPDAVVVWLSDSPELNRQSREKIEREADRIGGGRTVGIEEASFRSEMLEDGTVYFLNTQKLSAPGRLGQRGERRRWTIWEALAKTAREKADRFYFVIDEAHRGALGGEAGRATTIMQRFLKGWRAPDGTVMPPMPLVIGMSATAERFNRLAEGVSSTVAKTIVGPDEVRASGLLKDRILIGYPESAERAGDLSILAAATDEWLRKREHWERYCREQNCAPVDPVMVVQVEAGESGGAVSATDLAAVAGKIGERLGRPLREGEIVHTFGGARALDLEGLRVRAVEPSRIAGDHGIQVVLFKENLSTGWDCPRAETMVSFRTARDSTYIAQLLGRMVRTPLQRRIKADESLNEVRLFLPRFDAATVEGVIDALRSNECGEIPADAEAGAIGDGGWGWGTWTVRPGGRRERPDVPGQALMEYGPGRNDGGGLEVPHPQETPDEVPPPVAVRPGPGPAERSPVRAEQPELPIGIDREGIVRAVNGMALLTYEVRTRRTSDYLRALFALSGLLARTNIARDAREEAEAAAVAAIRDFAEGLRRSGRYGEMARRVVEMKIAVRVFDALGNPVAASGQMELAFASDEDLDRQLRAADNVLGGAGIANRYGRAFADDGNPADWKTDVILFAADPDRVAALQEEARGRFQALDNANRRYATSRGEALRAQYDGIVAGADAVSPHAFRLGEEVTAAATDREGRRWQNHLYVNDEGFATIALNGPEAALIEEEERRDDFASWLRNRARAPWVLCIPYEKDGVQTAMYPDFLVFRHDPGMEGGYVVDILEPHGAHFADSLAKAKGLAHYAEVERRCGRIQLIREDRDAAGRRRFVRLDLNRLETRGKVLRAASNEALADIFRSDGIAGDG